MLLAPELALAQTATPPSSPASSLLPSGIGGPEQWTSPEGLSSTLQVMILLTVISLAPALLLMTTSFIRILVVLGLLRQALGTQQLPPSQVITSIALFMTILLMTPVWSEVYDQAIKPYTEKQIDLDEAWDRGVTPIRKFMAAQIDRTDNHDDEHAEGEGDDHAHEEAAHEDHHDHHDHHGHDPHGWLDPENGRIWLDVIAAELSAADPENAETYRSNAEAGKAKLDSAIEQVMQDLEPVRGKPFIVFHDAYQYFENRFGISAAGSIKLGDATDPSPARIEEVHQKVQDLNITCVFSEPQFNPGLVQTVFGGSAAKTGMLDPLGTELELGPDFYPQLIQNVGASLADCLK